MSGKNFSTLFLNVRKKMFHLHHPLPPPLANIFGKIVTKIKFAAGHHRVLQGRHPLIKRG
jgi:hypothetical protein